MIRTSVDAVVLSTRCKTKSLMEHNLTYVSIGLELHGCSDINQLIKYSQEM